MIYKRSVSSTRSTYSARQTYAGKNAKERSHADHHAVDAVKEWKLTFL